MGKFSRYYFVIMVAMIILVIAAYSSIPDPLIRDGLAMGVFFGFLIGSTFESFWNSLYRECGVYES